jgi:hypothetical protein
MKEGDIIHSSQLKDGWTFTVCLNVGEEIEFEHPMTGKTTKGVIQAIDEKRIYGTLVDVASVRTSSGEVLDVVEEDITKTKFVQITSLGN